MKNIFGFACLILCLVLVSCDQDVNSGTPGAANQGSESEDGINGSYTAMIAVGNRLYYVDQMKLYTSDISDPQNITIIDEQVVGEEIETLFHRDGLLFIGSGPALYIYQLDAEGIPSLSSTTPYDEFAEDQTPCDPVVADARYAYVTLSTTESVRCRRQVPINQLRIYDVSDIEKPLRVSTTDMTNPKGLAIDGDILFVCDSNAGLKVYNVESREAPLLIHHFEGTATFDCIARNGLLIVSGPQAILEFDYTDIGNMQLIGSLEI